MIYSRYLDVSPGIARALKYSEPVVAIESGVLTQGLPFPESVEYAHDLEEIIRKEGSTPAVVGIINGKIRVGLSPDELRNIAHTPYSRKISRQDIPSVVALKHSGATTVGATMVIAQMAGIKIVLSGGIGAVHVSASGGLDMSADLDEFERTDVAVICSGAKFSTDMNMTLEYLETKGVPVIGYMTDEFPSFLSRSSGCFLEHSAFTPYDAACMIKTKWDLGIRGGLLLVNPVPEEYSIPLDIMKRYIDQARNEAQQSGIRGKQITPYVMKRITELTGQASLKAGSALLESNAAAASRIAKELSRLYT